MLPAIHRSALCASRYRFCTRFRNRTPLRTQANLGFYGNSYLFTISGPNQSRELFTKRRIKRRRTILSSAYRGVVVVITSVMVVGGLYYILNENEFTQSLAATGFRSDLVARADQPNNNIRNEQEGSTLVFSKESAPLPEDDSAWGLFTSRFETFNSITNLKWQTLADFRDYMLPDWAKSIPDLVNKLQRELSMAPGSLADEIWRDARDPYINPEIIQPASVRVSNDLCPEEKFFLQQRKKVTTKALAKYLGIPEEDVHPDDVPCIALLGSGGGLRALVAGAGSLHAAHEAGLFQCATYTAGVSGSCWLQSLYNCSLGGHRFDKLVAHLKARLGTHIAYPPVALATLNTAPTNKFLLSGFVEKLKGDRDADFGLVDVYGLLLAARLLVPKGELEVNDKDLKISSQRTFIQNGEYPMPIYTAVRHEIPIEEAASEVENITGHPSEATKEKAKKEAWFEWFEITPYEMFCEEFGAGIPTWAMGRKFKDGKDVPQDDSGLRVPELRLSFLLGVFGSAFCATLSHYYKEVRPIVVGLKGFGGIDGMIEGRNDDLAKVHPIEPASIPNFCLGMEGKLSETAPESIYKSDHLQLMDAGMSNNLPVYPLLRPGRDVDIIIAFDASADIKTENWISVVDGYAKQRGIKGWPIGAGWPRVTDSPEKTASELDEALPMTVAEADEKLEDAKAEQKEHFEEVEKSNGAAMESKGHYRGDKDIGDLGYCTVWVGTTEERDHTDSSTTPPLKGSAEEWQLMEPNAGITVVYFPFLSNPKVEGVDPVTSPYMSTWNFIYTPCDIDNVVALANANFQEGKDQTKSTVRAVYERKKRLRKTREEADELQRWRRNVRLGLVGKMGEGDHFS